MGRGPKISIAILSRGCPDCMETMGALGLLLIIFIHHTWPTPVSDIVSPAQPEMLGLDLMQNFLHAKHGETLQYWVPSTLLISQDLHLTTDLHTNLPTLWPSLDPGFVHSRWSLLLIVAVSLPPQLWVQLPLQEASRTRLQHSGAAIQSNVLSSSQTYLAVPTS